MYGDIVGGEDELRPGDVEVVVHGSISDGKLSRCVIGSLMPRRLKGFRYICEGKYGECEEDEDAEAGNASCTPSVETHEQLARAKDGIRVLRNVEL